MWAEWRVIRTVVGVVVLLVGLFAALARWVFGGGIFPWASPRWILKYDLRIYPSPSLHGQLLTHWAIIACWVLVGLSGVLLMTRWSDRLCLLGRIGVLLLPVALAQAVVLAPPFQPSQFTAIASVEGLSRLVKMQFPDGTQPIEARADHALDWTVKAKLRMPTKQVIPFIHGPFFERLRTESPHMRLDISRSSTGGLEFADNIPIKDWRPERLRKFVNASVGPGQYVDCLVADLSESPMSTVYFVFAVF